MPLNYMKLRGLLLMLLYGSCRSSITFCLSPDDIRVTQHNDARTLNRLLYTQTLEDEDRGGLLGEEMRNEVQKI